MQGNIRVVCPHCGADLTENAPGENLRHLQAGCADSLLRDRRNSARLLRLWLEGELDWRRYPELGGALRLAIDVLEGGR